MNTLVLEKITYLVGSPQIIEDMPKTPAKGPFDKEVLEFLSDVSKALMKDPRSKTYSDVVTFAFWIRAASLKRLKGQYGFKDGNIHMGRGTAFHIAPSNVPVNFAYSLAGGLLTGNANIVRVPSKDFPQVGIIVDAVNKVLAGMADDHDVAGGRNARIKPYIALIRYGHDKEINGALSGICDTRIIWGGDSTIAEIRKCPLPPRAVEVTFADRYSLALIDSDTYMKIEDKGRIAEDFYNDTYFSDQNACTSPRIVIWIGGKKEEAKKEFWNLLHDLVGRKYVFQDIMGVNKLVSSCLVATEFSGVKVLAHEDNYIVRIKVDKLDAHLMNYCDNSGFFFEFDCDDVMQLKNICDDKRCQTIGILGNRAWLRPLISVGVKGIDRIVSIGHTMDYDLAWDGYELIHV